MIALLQRITRAQVRVADRCLARIDKQVEVTNDGPVTFWLQVAGSTH
ncbi:MAG: hypothetical protein ACYC7I_00435 [Gammaproteobacteria bacterium]